MTESTIKFNFDINDIITIKETGLRGKVTHQCVDQERNIGYWVQYADRNGLISSFYFKESEITYGYHD